MYKEFYGLKESPFNVTSDPAFFYSSQKHSEAFSHLVYGIQQRKGIIVVSGEIGTGKTTLCRTVLNSLDETTKTAFILNPNFSELQLLQLILKDFGLERPFKNKLAMIDALNAFLLTETSQGHNVAIIIDEAQNLKSNQLEQVRLLSNLETEKEKLLQIILVGQPELLDKLQMPSLRQLRQRVSVQYHVHPLDKSEIENYINHRIKVASKDGQQQVHFTKQAIEAIFKISNGTPRVINILCDRALLAGFVGEQRIIDEQIIQKSSREIGTNA